MIDAAWIKTRIADELGLGENDLTRLYGVLPNELDAYLANLEADAATVVQRIVADVEAVRMGYRIIHVTAEQLQAIYKLIGAYRFHPLVNRTAASGSIAWHLGSDDAQYVAYRISDIVEIDFEWSDVLRMRMHRVILHYGDEAPPITQDFRDRVVEIATRLIELTGVL